MVKNKLKFLLILIFFFIFKPLLAEESWYQTAANLHKEWAKTYHTVKDIERYTNIHTQPARIRTYLPIFNFQREPSLCHYPPQAESNEQCQEYVDVLLHVIYGDGEAIDQQVWQIETCRNG